MLSFRLNREFEEKLELIAKSEKLSKSEIVKRALLLYFEEYQSKSKPYSIGADLFGRYGSSNGNLSKKYKRIIKEKLNEKHNR